MISQAKYFVKDLDMMLGKNKFRFITIWLTQTFWGIFWYRMERSLFLVFGDYYRYLRIVIAPINFLIQSITNIDIHYTADIKGGLLILHPSVGVVISGYSQIGEKLTLTGGNIIGSKAGSIHGDIRIGSNCTLGANAAIIGPVRLGNNIKIAAMACVVADCIIDGVTLIGVPAKQK